VTAARDSGPLPSGGTSSETGRLGTANRSVESHGDAIAESARLAIVLLSVGSRETVMSARDAMESINEQNDTTLQRFVERLEFRGRDPTFVFGLLASCSRTTGLRLSWKAT
jgi:hypothetical protein